MALLGALVPEGACADLEDESSELRLSPATATEPQKPDTGADAPKSHPLLSVGDELNERSADMMSRIDDSGHSWAVEEGWGSDDDSTVNRYSGLVRVEAIKSSPERRVQLNLGKPPRKENGDRPARDTLDKIDSRLLDPESVSITADGQADVAIRLRKVDRGTVDDQLMSLMLSRDVQSPAELAEARTVIMEERAADIAAAAAPVHAIIDEVGGEVTYEQRAIFVLNARLAPSDLLLVAALPEVESIEGSYEVTNSASGDGVAKGSQINQFITSGHDGENGSSNPSHVAVVENERLWEEHVGFHEGTGSSDRIASRTNCTSAPCTFPSNWLHPGTSPADAHATYVAGLVLGDLRDGQDSTVTGGLGRRRRSGYAGEARLHMYRAEDGTLGLIRALEHIAGRDGANRPRLVNLSLNAHNNDPTCNGESALSEAANEVFESGALIIASAGNTGHPDPNDCRVGAPGSAIGVFTVGGHGVDTDDNQVDVRHGPIWTDSSQGGSTTEGDGRSIIDVTASACRKYLFDPDGGGYGLTGCGTSISAPTVTAGAVDYASWYRHFNNSTFIDNPGVMFTALLIQGDRQGTFSDLTHGFHALWGAGRLKMRKGSNAGMDSPYLWKFGSTCVGDGEEKIIPINSGTTLPNDVDDLKAVIYWYDPQHALGIAIDDIDLYLENTAGSTIRSSASYHDNKERVYTSGAGGTAYQLRLIGNDVTFDSSSTCGQDSMLVYYSYFYEDDDRDDGNGPPLSEIDPE